MAFTHDTESVLQSCVDLVNGDPDHGPLSSVAALAEHFDEYEYMGRHDNDEAELQAVRRLVPRMRDLLLAERDAAVDLVNEELARAHALPQLQRHGTWDWHLHAIGPDRPLAERIAVETAMAMVDVIRVDECDRITICAAERCEDVALDLSRNRSKKYCSTACGNREAVAAYRARQRA